MADTRIGCICGGGDDGAFVRGWVYLLFVGGATQAPQLIYFLSQRHHGAARC